MKKYIFFIIGLFFLISACQAKPSDQDVKSAYYGVFAKDEPDTRIIDDAPAAFERKDRVRSNNYFTNTYTSLNSLIKTKEDKNYLRGKVVTEPIKDKYLFYDGEKYIHREVSGGDGIKSINRDDSKNQTLTVEVNNTVNNPSWDNNMLGTHRLYLPQVDDHGTCENGLLSRKAYEHLIDKYDKKHIDGEFNKTNTKVSTNTDNITHNAEVLLNHTNTLSAHKKTLDVHTGKLDTQGKDITKNTKSIIEVSDKVDTNRKSIETVKVELAKKIEEAPKDDKTYGRKGGEWNAIPFDNPILSLSGDRGNTIYGHSQGLRIEVSDHVSEPQVYSDRGALTHYFRFPNAEVIGTKGGLVSHQFVEYAKSKAAWDVCGHNVLVEEGGGLKKATFEGKVKLSVEHPEKIVGKKIKLTAQYWGTKDKAPVDITIEQNGMELFKGNGEIETYLPVGGFTGHLKMPEQEIDEKVDMPVTADKDFAVSKHLCRVWVKMLNKKGKPLEGFDPICQVNIGGATKDYQLDVTDFAGISRTNNQLQAKGTKIRFKALLYGKPHFSEWQTNLREFPYSFTWHVDLD